MYRSLFIVLMLNLSFSLTAKELSNLVIKEKSQQGIYQTKLECDSSFTTGYFQKCWLTLVHADQSVEDVEIFIDGGMPAHSHGLPTSPKVVWSGDRKAYLIQGLKFSMPGQWVLNFKVNAKETSLKDQITMLFEVN